MVRKSNAVAVDTGSPSIEETVATLQSWRDELTTRRAAAVGRREAARQARIEVLKVGGELEKHNVAMRDASDEIGVIDELAVEVDAQLSKAEAQLSAQRDAVERDQLAAQLEGMVPGAEAAAAEIDVAMGAVASAFNRLVATLPERMVLAQLDGKPAGRNDIARTLLAESLAAACPGAFSQPEYRGHTYHATIERRFHNGTGYLTSGGTISQLRDEPAPRAAELATSLIGKSIADRADAIRNSTAAKSLDDFAPPAQPRQATSGALPKPIDIIAREAFWAQPDAAGEPTTVEQYATATFPADFAGLAITTGLAFRAGSEQAADMLADQKRGKTRPRGGGWGIIRQSDGSLRSVQDMTGPKTSVKRSAA